MMTNSHFAAEVDKNLETFLNELPKLLPTHRGKFAVLRHQKIEGFYDTVMDAVTAANAAYADGAFSVQQVIDLPTDLGFYSHAVQLADP